MGEEGSRRGRWAEQSQRVHSGSRACLSVKAAQSSECERGRAVQGGPHRERDTFTLDSSPCSAHCWPGRLQSMRTELLRCCTGQLPQTGSASPRSSPLPPCSRSLPHRSSCTSEGYIGQTSVDPTRVVVLRNPRRSGWMRAPCSLCEGAVRPRCEEDEGGWTRDCDGGERRVPKDSLHGFEFAPPTDVRDALHSAWLDFGCGVRRQAPTTAGDVHAATPTPLARRRCSSTSLIVRTALPLRRRWPSLRSLLEPVQPCGYRRPRLRRK